MIDIEYIGEKTIIRVRCLICKTVYKFTVDSAAWAEYNMGNRLIQDCLPELSADWREMLISQVCPTCFDRMFHDV